VSTPSQSWDVSDDNELEAAVRAQTQYDDGKLSASDMDTHIKNAKRELALRADVDQFYDDRGIAHALFGLVCAFTKGGVENSPVVTKNLGTEDVTFRTSAGSSLQLDQYESIVETGLGESAKTDAGIRDIHLTGTYFSDTSSGPTNENYQK